MALLVILIMSDDDQYHSTWWYCCAGAVIHCWFWHRCDLVCRWFWWCWSVDTFFVPAVIPVWSRIVHCATFGDDISDDLTCRGRGVYNVISISIKWLCKCLWPRLSRRLVYHAAWNGVSCSDAVCDIFSVTTWYLDTSQWWIHWCDVLLYLETHCSLEYRGWKCCCVLFIRWSTAGESYG